MTSAIGSTTNTGTRSHDVAKSLSYSLPSLHESLVYPLPPSLQIPNLPPIRFPTTPRHSPWLPSWRAACWTSRPRRWGPRSRRPRWSGRAPSRTARAPSATAATPTAPGHGVTRRHTGRYGERYGVLRRAYGELRRVAEITKSVKELYGRLRGSGRAVRSAKGVTEIRKTEVERYAVV